MIGSQISTTRESNVQRREDDAPCVVSQAARGDGLHVWGFMYGAPEYTHPKNFASDALLVYGGSYVP